MRIAETSAPNASSAVNKPGKQSMSSSIALSSRQAPAVETGPDTIEPSTRTWKRSALSRDKDTIQRAADRVNEDPSIIQRRLRFKVHDKTGQVFVEVTNADTGKILSTIPSEAVLDLEARFQSRSSNDAPALVVDRRA